MKENEKVQNMETVSENKPSRKSVKSRLMSVLVAVMAFALSALPAFADDGTASSASLTGGVATIVELVGQVVNLITGNTILLAMLAAGLLSVAIGVFARLFHSVRS